MFLEIFYLHRGSYIIPFMSGHNKWAQIKRQKGAADAAKSNLWGKTNMPKDTIERAIAKGAAADSAELESILYESYGPGGAAILIQTVTDSRNRTAQEIKHLLTKNGLALAAVGSAAWAFEKTAEGYEPKSTVPLSDADNEHLMKILEEIDAYDDVEDVYTNAE